MALQLLVIVVWVLVLETTTEKGLLGGLGLKDEVVLCSSEQGSFGSRLSESADTREQRSEAKMIL